MNSEECEPMWNTPELDAKWPRRYRQHVWQVELAEAMLGPSRAAQLEAEVIAGATAPVSQTASPPTRL